MNDDIVTKSSEKHSKKTSAALDICDTWSWEPKFLKSFVIFVNMQSLSLNTGPVNTPRLRHGATGIGEYSSKKSLSY